MPAETSPLDVAVVLVNYERPEDTIDCIHSLRRSQGRPFRIVLVDNGSKDDSVARLSAAFPELAIIRIADNIMFTGGHNRGIQAALESGATHVFILNNDTIVDPAAVESLLRATEQHDWDIAVPKIVYYDDPGLIWAAGAHYRRFPPGVVMNGFQRRDGPAYRQPIPLEYATGCAFFARRKVFEITGGFDHTFGCYNEDYDFFYRCNAAGLRSGYQPEAKILHKVSRTLGRNPAGQRFYLARNTVLFFLKDGRFPRPVFWAHVAWIYLREGLKGNFAQWKDYRAGYREGFRVLAQVQGGQV